MARSGSGTVGLLVAFQHPSLQTPSTLAPTAWNLYAFLLLLPQCLFHQLLFLPLPQWWVSSSSLLPTTCTPPPHSRCTPLGGCRHQPAKGHQPSPSCCPWARHVGYLSGPPPAQHDNGDCHRAAKHLAWGLEWRKHCLVPWEPEGLPIRSAQGDQVHTRGPPHSLVWL